MVNPRAALALIAELSTTTKLFITDVKRFDRFNPELSCSFGSRGKRIEFLRNFISVSHEMLEMTRGFLGCYPGHGSDCVILKFRGFELNPD